MIDKNMVAGVIVAAIVGAALVSFVTPGPTQGTAVGAAQTAPVVLQFPATNSEKGCVILFDTIDLARYDRNYNPDTGTANALNCAKAKMRHNNPEDKSVLTGGAGCHIFYAGLYSFSRTNSFAPVDTWTQAKIAKGCAMMMFDLSEEQFWNTELGRLMRHKLGNGNVVP